MGSTGVNPTARRACGLTAFWASAMLRRFWVRCVKVEVKIELIGVVRWRYSAGSGWNAVVPSGADRPYGEFGEYDAVEAD